MSKLVSSNRSLETLESHATDEPDTTKESGAALFDKNQRYVIMSLVRTMNFILNPSKKAA